MRDEILFTVSSSRGFSAAPGSLIAMATMALQSGSHVLCFITNSAMTQCLSGFAAKGVCSEKLLWDPEIMKVPLNKNIKRNLLVLRPPTQGRQSLCLFISDLFFSHSLFDSSFFLSISLCALSLLYMPQFWSIYTYSNTLILALYFYCKIFPGGLLNVTACVWEAQTLNEIKKIEIWLKQAPGHHCCTPFSVLT